MLRRDESREPAEPGVELRREKKQQQHGPLFCDNKRKVNDSMACLCVLFSVNELVSV